MKTGRFFWAVFTLCMTVLAGPLAWAQNIDCGPISTQSPCSGRQGQCMQLTLDGLKTEPLLGVGKRAQLSKLISGVKVCWQMSQALPRDFTIAAKAGGLNPSWLGEIESIDIVAHDLSDFDEELGGKIDQMGRTVIEDGRLYYAPFGQTPKLLDAGEYVLTFRARGTGNWDRQSVLLNLK